MKTFKLAFFLACSLMLCMHAECMNQSNKDLNEAANNAEYYEMTPPPPYIVERFGPFGPQEKSYPIPDDAVIVAPDGLDANDGKSIDKPTTLKKAVESAVTGTVIVLRGGIYRTGDLIFNKKITIQPYLNERPVIKGSKIASEWVKKGDYWVTKWDLYPDNKPRPSSLKIMGDRYYGDLVMFNGKMFRPVFEPSDLENGKFYCDYDANEVYISEDPSGKEVEITAYTDGFVREHDETADAEGPTIQGLDMMHFRNSCITIQEDNPHRVILTEISGNPGEMPFAPVNSRIENCRLLFCVKYGLRITSPDSYIGYNDISMIGYVAVEPFMSHNSVFEHNTINHSNWFNFRTFPAGIKVFNQSYNYIVRNNNFSDMPCEAVWYDVGHREGVVVNNYFYNCGIGVKIEISHRTYVAGNVFKNANLWFCNSYNCLAYNNTLIDSRLDLWRNNRGEGAKDRNYHAFTGPRPFGYHGHHVANNVFAGQGQSGFYFLIEDNKNWGEVILDKNFQAEILAHNLFLNEAEWIFDAEFQPKELPDTKYASLTEFREDYGEFEDGNVQLNITQDKLFRSKADGDFRLRNVPGIPDGVELPEYIAKLLGWEQANPGLGAFAQPHN